MKKPTLIITTLFISIVVLSIARIALVNSISTTGTELASLQTELQEYKKQNELLKERYLEESSLTNLEKKAEKLGFVEAKSQLPLTAPLPLARRQ